MKDLGFRLEVKMGKKWKLGKSVFATEEEAMVKGLELTRLARKANKNHRYRVVTENKIFGLGA